MNLRNQVDGHNKVSKNFKKNSEKIKTYSDPRMFYILILHYKTKEMGTQPSDAIVFTVVC